MGPTIYIVGAGAIGKVLAVFLQARKRNVVVLHGRSNRPFNGVEKITVNLNDGDSIDEDLVIQNLDGMENLDGIVVLTNKSYGNRDLAAKLKNKINKSPLVILQNGLNVEEPFSELAFPQVYRGVLFATSQYTETNSLRFKPVTASPVGIIRGDEATLKKIVDLVNCPAFPFVAEASIQKVIWKKAIINCVFNSVCPLLETDNGIFYRNQEAKLIAERIIAEGVEVASAKGIVLNPVDVLNGLLLVSKSSDGQLISTYQDILNKRPTEIETLNFAITGAAAAAHKENAVKEIRLLGDLIALKSALSMSSLTQD